MVALVFHAYSPLTDLAQPSIGIYPHLHPLLHLTRPKSLIKLDARFIPLQNAPLKPVSSNPLYLERQFPEQSLSIPFTPELWPYKQVLQVYARPCAPCGVIVEVQSHAGAMVWIGGRRWEDQEGLGIP